LHDSFRAFWYIVCQDPFNGLTCRLGEGKQDTQLSQRQCCTMHYSFGQKWKTETGRRYFTDNIRL